MIHAVEAVADVLLWAGVVGGVVIAVVLNAAAVTEARDRWRARHDPAGLVALGELLRDREAK